MNPRDYHILATELARGRRAVDFRSAINRAYYATYNVGVEILEGMGFKIDKGPKGHHQVQRRLNNCGVDEIISVASKLGDLYSRRIDADYRLENLVVEQKKNAEALVKQAGEMIETIDGSCTGENRKQIIATIKEYLEKFHKGSV